MRYLPRIFLNSNNHVKVIKPSFQIESADDVLLWLNNALKCNDLLNDKIIHIDLEPLQLGNYE